MNTIIDLMLAIRENCTIFYHKDSKQFDFFPFSEFERRELSPDKQIPYNDRNNFRLPSSKQINHEEIMRFYVSEYVENKESRKQLFGILSRKEYMDAFLDALRELNLYEDFIDACGEIYIQIFEDWADKNDLDFK